MRAEIKERHSNSNTHTSRFAFWIIALMHDNPLLPILRNPYKLLEAAGLKRGQKVVEVGCGPGFFTIPAAKIVDEEGFIYAIDVNPFAIKRVKEKIAEEGLKNVEPLLEDASQTGLPDESIDLAFIFGLRYIAGGLRSVLSEMHRILKPGALLSFEKTTGSSERLTQEAERADFTYLDKRGRIFLFTNGKTDKVSI
jgi:ubiquinone/menaquinone biosynthesis C-methylase UbiE